MPPDKPIIAQPRNAKLKLGVLTIRPENTSIVLRCIVYDGDPLPKVTWSKNGVEIESSSERYL